MDLLPEGLRILTGHASSAPPNCWQLVVSEEADIYGN